MYIHILFSLGCLKYCNLNSSIIIIVIIIARKIYYIIKVIKQTFDSFYTSFYTCRPELFICSGSTTC